MVDLIGLIILVAIYLISKASLNHKVDNYDISKVSSAKMAMDYDKSPEYRQRKMVSGAYDKDVNHPY